MSQDDVTTRAPPPLPVPLGREEQFQSISVTLVWGIKICKLTKESLAM